MTDDIPPGLVDRQAPALLLRLLSARGFSSEAVSSWKPSSSRAIRSRGGNNRTVHIFPHACGTAPCADSMLSSSGYPGSGSSVMTAGSFWQLRVSKDLVSKVSEASASGNVRAVVFFNGDGAGTGSHHRCRFFHSHKAGA